MIINPSYVGNMDAMHIYFVVGYAWNIKYCQLRMNYFTFGGTCLPWEWNCLILFHVSITNDEMHIYDEMWRTKG